MYIEKTICGYDRSGEQIARRALFLIFAQPEWADVGENPANWPIRCAVRKVALRQFGHWMMGRVRLFGAVFTVSGAYGADGLPMTISKRIYDQLPMKLPPDLYNAWSKGNGWNSAGSEAPLVRQWALDNLETLRGKRAVETDTK